MTFQQIIIFLTVAEEQSCTRAAQKLFISQPTVSREVALLEQELGCALFMRGMRTVTLTDAGVRLLPEARRVRSICESMSAIARGTSENVRGTVRIGYFDNAQLDRLMERVALFFEQHPGVELESIYNAPMNLLEDFKNKKTNVMLGFRAALPEKHGPVFVLERSSLCVLALKGDPLFGRKSVSLPELADRLIVTIDPVQMPNLCRSYYGICGRAGFVPRIIATGKMTADVKLQARRNKAIAFVSTECMYMPDSDVCVIPVEGDYPETDIIAVLQNGPASDTMGMLVDMLQQNCAELNRPELGDGI